MNDKIKAWEGKHSDLFPSPSQYNKPFGDVLVVLSVSGETRTDKHAILRVSFLHRVLLLTGWQNGDRLDIDIEGETVLIFRSDAGRKLCASSPRGGRNYIRYTYPAGSLDGFPVGVPSAVEAVPGKIAFTLPKQPGALTAVK